MAQARAQTWGKNCDAGAARARSHTVEIQKATDIEARLPDGHASPRPGIGKPRGYTVELELVPVLLVCREIIQHLIPCRMFVLGGCQEAVVLRADAVEAPAACGVEHPGPDRNQLMAPDCAFHQDRYGDRPVVPRYCQQLRLDCGRYAAQPGTDPLPGQEK